MMNYFALCHFTSDMSSRCVIGSGACEDTYSFRHVLSPTNEVQQFIVSSIILILLPARKFKTLPQLNALLGLVLMHLLVRDCLVHLLARDCLVHLLARDCLVHLLARDCLVHLLVRDCLVHLLVRDCLVHLLVRDCLVHLLVRDCLVNRVKFLGPLMKNVVKTNEIARSLILHSTSPIAVKVCSST